MTQQLEIAPSDRSTRNDRLALAIRAITAPRRYIRPWYLAYLLLGMVTAGLLPVLLPLTVEALSHRLSTVAYVLGAYNFGLLTSPLWGMLAERIKAYRNLFLGSFLLTAAGILGMVMLRELPSWLVSAFALGAGSGGAATLATLFIVDFTVQAEWEARIGWLESFNASGQVVGLLLAAAFSGGDTSVALWVSVAIVLLAMALGGVGLPLSKSVRPAGTAAQSPHLHLNVRALAIFPKLSLPSGVGLHFYHLNLPGLLRLPQAVGTRFGRFLLSWFVLAFAVAAFFSYFPLMLSESYHIATRTTAMIYAGTSAVGIALYVLTSHLTARYGAGRVYQSVLALRMVGFGLLLAPFLVSFGNRSLFGAVGFALIVIAWPLLNVSGTDLGARLTPFSEGAAVGLLNAALALATAVGIVLSGPLVAQWGYKTIPATALAGLAASFLLGINAWNETRGAPEA
ncbi:MAG: MFS transporter [Acidobacteriaceae bacterium]|nr:MFS transporter [Acidobacteriaceae bacterium]